VEKTVGNAESDDQVASRVSDALKSRIAVKPAAVSVLRDGDLPRATREKGCMSCDLEQSCWNGWYTSA